VTTIVLPFPPSVNHYYLRTRSGQVFLGPKAVAFRERVHFEWLALSWMPFECPISLEIRAFRPRVVGDIDNVLKATLDALNRRYFVDDRQVVRLLVHLDHDPDCPRLEVTIECVDPAPVRRKRRSAAVTGATAKRKPALPRG
jgi:crossover junction endodeoxyribonuclease RusA